MSRKPPAEPIDHHYNIPKLNRVFFWTGALLTAIFLWMVWDDFDRPWKSVQKLFFRIDARKTREAALAAREKAYGEERDKLIGQLGDARREVAQHRASLERLRGHVAALEPKIYAADQRAKFSKASFDAALYTYEA